MDLEELFEGNKKHHGNYRNQAYHDHHKHSDYGNTHDSHFKIAAIFEKIRHNKMLKLFVFISVVLILVFTVGLIILLFPMLVKLYDYVIQNGLQGIIDYIYGLLNTILKGSGK